MDNGGTDFSKMLENLMADEKFRDIVAAVKNNMSGDTNEKDDIPDEEKEATAPQISPEMLSRLPQIMSVLAPSVGGSSHDSKGLSDKKKLLQALRPFLGERRREAIDSIVNIAGIADLFGI